MRAHYSNLGSFEGDEEGCAETLDDPDGEVEGPVTVDRESLKKAYCSN
jgi:hypothetical protein